MSEAHFAFALSRGYTQIDYFLAISFRSSILACFSQFWRPWGFSIYHSRSRLLAFCSDLFRLAALILQNPSQHLRGARGRNIVLYSYGKLLLKSKVNDDELPSLFLKVPLTFQVVWKVAGTCPHLHSIIGIHFRRTHHGNTHAKYHSVSKTLHYTSLRSPAPNIISSCFYRVFLQEIRWKQLVRIRPPNSFPNDFDVLARFCELTGKWLPIPCFTLFLRVIMVLLACIPITSPKRK